MTAILLVHHHRNAVALLASAMVLVACGGSDGPDDLDDPTSVRPMVMGPDSSSAPEPTPRPGTDSGAAPGIDESRRFDPEAEGDAEYFMSTEFLGSGQQLSADRGADGTVALFFSGAGLGETDATSPQDWRLEAVDADRFRIVNRDLVGLSLDVANDGVFERVQMAVSGDFSGQFWTVTPLDNGYCRLTNSFLGTEIALDVAPDEEPRVPTMRSVDNASGQHWRLAKIDGSASVCDPSAIP